MKNYCYLFLFVCLFTACSEDKPIFQESSETRLSEYIAQSNATLLSVPCWKMTYYPVDTLGGYSFLFKFKENNRVEIASESGDFKESSYRVDLSQGPMLVFDSYNYIHDLANPNDAMGARGTGLYGDYEFIIQKITENALQLTGRKRGVNVQLEKATEEDEKDLAIVRNDLLKCFELQASEYWALSINNKRVVGSIAIDMLKHLYTIHYGTSDDKISGAYLMTPDGLKFNKPVSVKIEDKQIDFDGLLVKKDPQTIASNDPSKSLTFTVKSMIPVTEANISTYKPDEAMNVVSAFKNLKNSGSSTNVSVTLMSPKLEDWRAIYKAEFPAFSQYVILMPRSTYDISFTARYDKGGSWYWGPDPAVSATGFNPMTGSGHNPLYEVSFSLSRSSSSTAPSGYNTDENGGAKNFRNFLQQADGFTIIQDGNAFWFRSNADSNDWFKTEPE